MNSWNKNELKEFLKLIGEDEYIECFINNSIHGNHLKIIDEEMLKSMNIPLIHCKNIIKQRDYYTKWFVANILIYFTDFFFIFFFFFCQTVMKQFNF